MMKKNIILTVCLLLIAVFAEAKDVKVIVNSNGEGKVNVMKTGLMTMPVCELILKNGVNEIVTDKITEKGMYFISYKYEKASFSTQALIDPEIGGFVINVDPVTGLSFDGENKNFNNAVVAITKKEESSKLYSFKNITEERTKCAYAIYEKMLKDSKALKLSKKERAMLAGYAQGCLLSNVYSVIEMSKVFGKMSQDLVIDDHHADFMAKMKLLPYVNLYPTWHSSLVEFMYTRINNGMIKIHDVNSWIADMANSIEDKNLRDAFILETLDREVIMGYGKDIKIRFDQSKKLVTDPAVLAKINELEVKSQAIKSTGEGEYVGDLVFEDVNGQQVSLDQFKGKYVFIDIWSTGCNPCIGEIPYMKKIEHAFADKNIAWVSVSLDTDKEVWKKFMEKNKMAGNQWICPNGFKHPFCRMIGLRGIPCFLLIDKEGKIFNSGTYRPSNPVLKEQLNFIVK